MNGQTALQTSTARVNAAVVRLEILQQFAGQVILCVLDSVDDGDPSGHLQQRRRIVGEVTDESAPQEKNNKCRENGDEKNGGEKRIQAA